jgi:hypothetical protein
MQQVGVAPGESDGAASRASGWLADWLRPACGGVVVVLAQDEPFQGSWRPLRGWGLAKASACLQANDGDAC